MGTSSILGGTRPDRQADGKQVDVLGPSDSSDSGSDVRGERAMPTAPDAPDELGAVPLDPTTDTDASGTGERASADDASTPDGLDILPDRIIDDLGASGDPAKRAKSFEAADLSVEEGTEDPDEAEDDDA